MAITNTDLAPINENLKGIRDYTQKLEALETFNTKYTANNKALLGKIQSIGGDLSVLFKLRTIASDILKSTKSLDKTLDKLNSTLVTVLSAKEDRAVATVKPQVEAKPVDRKLTAAVSETGKVTKSAIVEAETQAPDLGIPKVVTALTDMTDLQKENNKLFYKLLNAAEKRDKDKQINALLGNDEEKEKSIPQEETKVERPKLPFSFKEFMGGLGNILKGLLNPVALIAAFIMKSLPYVLIAIAFLKGFWRGIGAELRDKFTDIGKKVLLGVGVVFGLFRGIPLLIKTLQLAYHAARMVALTAIFVKDMALWALKVTHENTIFGKALVEFLFKRAIEIAKFVMHVAYILFKKTLAVAEFVLVAGGILLIVGMFVLLIAGIFVLFSMFGDKIIDGVKKVIDIFKIVGNFIMDAMLAIPKMIVNGVLSLFKGIGNLFSLFRPESKQETTVQVDQSSEVTFSSEMQERFNDSIKQITEPLHAISKAVKSIALSNAANTLINGVGNVVGMPIRAIASIVTAVQETNESSATTTNADRISSNVNQNIYSTTTDTVSEIRKPIDSIEENINKLYTLMQNWYDHSDKKNMWFTPANSK